MREREEWRGRRRKRERMIEKEKEGEGEGERWGGRETGREREREEEEDKNNITLIAEPKMKKFLKWCPQAISKGERGGGEELTHLNNRSADSRVMMALF